MKNSSKERFVNKTESQTSLAGCVILVIGGTGLSGSYTVRRFLSLATEDTIVRIMSRSANVKALKRKLGADVEVVRGDVADPSAVRKAMVGVTHILYIVGPKPSPAYFVNGKTMEGPYVTGLENVLGEGVETLRQVILLSAENCDKPWHPLTMFANNIAGYTQLMHFRQERLLREEAKRRSEFGYVVIRAPLLGPADVLPEAITLQSVETSDTSRLSSTRMVSRAAVSEFMVHALATAPTTTQRCVTLTLASDGEGPAPAGFDWKGCLDALPQDHKTFTGPESDVSHVHGRWVFLLGVLFVLLTAVSVVTAMGFWLLS